MDKKAQIWISAVLYMALGVVVLTIILAAGVPMIQKMKDKNVYGQTKDLFDTLDKNIKEVSGEGPGSKRFLAPFEVKAGDLRVSEDSDVIIWSLKTKAKLMEPSYDEKGASTGVPEFREGGVSIYMNDTNIVGEYMLYMRLDYKETADLDLTSQFEGPLTGAYNMAIIHKGEYHPTTYLPVVEIKVTV